MTNAVWITPDFPWEEQPVGGIFHQTQARALVRLGVGVTVLRPTPWVPWPLSRVRERWRHYAHAPRVANDGGITVVRPRYPNVPGQPGWAVPDRMIAGAAWRTRREWRGAALIHGHSVVEGLAAWRLARRSGLPFVLTFHGSDINTWPADHPDRLGDLRRAAGDAGAVVAVSAALADRIRAVTGVEAVHLPIGSDHRSLAASVLSRPEARDLLELPDDRVIVLFVGHLLRAKGVRELVDAVLKLGDPFLAVLVGSGPEAGYGQMNARPSAWLRYTGEQPHPTVVRYMCAADVLVLPSYSEGLPTVLVEAGSLALPVIASAVGGIPELLGHDRGTILPRPSAEGITATLTAFLEDRPSAESAARRLQEHVRNSYDVDVNAARLLDLYRSVASTPRRAALSPAGPG